jgi:biopolymer transport protein TolR
MLNQGVEVTLPQAAAQAIPKQEQEPIIVSVDAKGNYYLNIAATPDQPISPEDLAARVTAELQVANQAAPAQQRQVLVKGDQQVDYGKVVQAMVLLQHAGAATVGLMTQPAENSH